MLDVKKITKNYATTVILSEVSFSLGKGEKAALIGFNGVGKTTLLKIIAGLEEPDSGSIEMQNGVCIGYLQQDTSLMEVITIIDYLKNVSGICHMEKKLEELSIDLGDSVKAKEYGEIQEKYDHIDGYSFAHRARMILIGLGFNESDLEKSTKNLSSGQKVKVALTGILLKGVDLLLLDEPTDNLDLPSLIWLENFLKTSLATAIIVSHDRNFLDKVANKIIEIDVNTKKVIVTGGKYSDYLSMSLKKLERALQTYRLQQGEIKRLTAEAHRKKMEAQQGSRWRGSDNDKHLQGFKRERAGGSGRQAKAIQTRIDRIEKIESPIEREPLELIIEAPHSPGVLSISTQDMIVGYKGGFVLGPISLEINYGDRVGIMGLNGSGKSTILKTIAGILVSLEGKVTIGSGIRLGNMMQEHELLPRSLTPYEFLQQKANLSLQDSYALMAKFGFVAEQTKRLIGELSPGGRARLTLALFSALSVNTLILDEPTNHLDIEAAQALEEVLYSYEGTVILVSHDRYFLEKAKLDTVYLVVDGVFSRIKDYKEYIASAEKRAVKLVNTM